jgi:hypothetical protein
MPCFILVSITLYKIFISALISDNRSSFDMMLDIKFLLHSLIAVYLACFLTTQEKYFYPRPTCIFRI